MAEVPERRRRVLRRPSCRARQRRRPERTRGDGGDAGRLDHPASTLAVLGLDVLSTTNSAAATTASTPTRSPPTSRSSGVVDGMFDHHRRGVRTRVPAVSKTPRLAPRRRPVRDLATPDRASVSAYFYADLFPREGKFGHAAAFPLVYGRRRSPTATYRATGGGHRRQLHQADRRPARRCSSTTRC